MKIALTSAFAVFALCTSAFSQLNLALPNDSGRSIAMTGTSSQPVGGVSGASLSGHAIISLNSNPGGVAYYYLMGAEATALPGYTDTSAATGFTSMATTASYISDNSLTTGNLRLRFGPTGVQSNAWNLGADVNGVNYWASAASEIEERIYAANPGNVEAALYYAGTKLMVFNYTSLYIIIDYNNVGDGDDTIQAYSDPVPFSLAGGLGGTDLGLAQALQTDFNAGGGFAQLRFDSIQTASREDAVGTLGVYGTFSFNGTVQAVPEPASMALFALGLAVCGFFRRRCTV